MARSNAGGKRPEVAKGCLTRDGSDPFKGQAGCWCSNQLLKPLVFSPLNELHAHLSSIRSSYAGLEVLTEDGEVIVELHQLFAVKEMLLKRARLLSQDWRGNS